MNIIITGASRGLGAALARKAGFSSSNRIILLSRNEPVLRNLKKTIEGQNPNANVMIYSVDLSSGDKISQFTGEIQKEVEKIDILINNAGLLVNKDYSEQNSTDIRRMFAVNYFGPAQLIKELMPLLTSSENAHVVNIGSMGAVQGSVKFPGLNHYSSSKAALAVLTECLAEEYKTAPVKFNYLALGAVQTEMLEEAFPGYKAPNNADEMAEFIMDFAMRGHRFMSGKIVPVSLSTP